MGVFLQFALFPGCQEEATRQAVEGAARNPQFTVDLDQCLYSASYEGTQVLIAGELGFDALAKELSRLAQNPVMLLYLYDGDFWGYDFYGGREEDHFSTMPDYFEPISQAEKERLAGNPAALVGWFPTWDQALLSRYLLHWTDHEEELEEGFACSGDSAPYGDCWQATDFAARLGFPWPFDQAMEEAGIPLPPPLPTLGEILEQGIPPMSQEAAELLERSPLLRLPHALTPEYQLALLADPRVAELRLKEKNPREASESITGYCVSVKLSDRDPLCQRLAAVAAFCDFWLSGVDWAWGWLDKATYEPVYGAYEKPRAAIFSPFSALSGHASAIAETARLTEQRIELDEDTKAELDRRQAILLEHIREQPEITVTWFQPDELKEGGAYLTTTGRLKKIDPIERTLVLLDGPSIQLEDVFNLESPDYMEPFL